MPDPETVYNLWQAGNSFIKIARDPSLAGGQYTLAAVVMAARSWSATL